MSPLGTSFLQFPGSDLLYDTHTFCPWGSSAGLHTSFRLQWCWLSPFTGKSVTLAGKANTLNMKSGFILKTPGVLPVCLLGGRRI